VYPSPIVVSVRAKRSPILTIREISIRRDATIQAFEMIERWMQGLGSNHRGALQIGQSFMRAEQMSDSFQITVDVPRRTFHARLRYATQFD
jgi:hypothetical protein